MLALHRLSSVAACLLIAGGTAIAQVDESPLDLQPTIAFPDLVWSGWSPVTSSGLNQPLRPIVLTHAGDQSNRVFVATQRGVIHVFENSDKPQETKVYLDISSRVTYSDDQNEEGFLGLTFHPDYQRNGEFFVYYTTSEVPQTSVISRFRVSPEDPDRADPESEQEILRIKQPFWNHNGGTVIFGPDGYLYIGLGDGGKANDPFGHGQNLETLLGSILRLDIDRKSEDKKYAIPQDNPFVDREGQVRGEIWAYGLRNVWRMAFDRKTGLLWAADVGQDTWEEINIIRRGGNYGWNLREGMHPFGPHGAERRDDLIEPIWEYHHRIGESITGGFVYRGDRLPEIEGAYLYADYVSGRLWALRYDAASRKVTANHPIPSEKLSVLSFGEDEQANAYFMVASATGKGIYRLQRTAGGASSR